LWKDRNTIFFIEMRYYNHLCDVSLLSHQKLFNISIQICFNQYMLSLYINVTCYVHIYYAIFFFWLRKNSILFLIYIYPKLFIIREGAISPVRSGYYFSVVQHSHHTVYSWFIMIVYSDRSDSAWPFMSVCINSITHDMMLSVLLSMFWYQFRHLINTIPLKKHHGKQMIFFIPFRKIRAFHSLINS